jgi:hypothetical protein
MSYAILAMDILILTSVCCFAICAHTGKSFAKTRDSDNDFISSAKLIDAD